ncbi:MAG: GlxA family transcriptional regulator [bacterium]|nr:GlxA family transcriptional regulator [bacterium]
MLRIGILAFEGCIYSSILGFLDVFSIANRVAREQFGTDAKPFNKISIITRDGQSVLSFNGIRVIPDMAIQESGPFEIIYIPAMMDEAGNPFLDRLLASEESLAWLRHHHQIGTCISSVCVGSFLLAEAGLLEGLQATTHWQLAPEFSKKYPAVHLKPQKMIIDEGRLITAGGITAYLDLSLYLISKFGSPELAAVCSKVLLIDPGRRNQTPYQMPLPQNPHGDTDIEKVQNWLDTHYKESVSIEAMSKICGLGERTFLRRFKKAVGDSPVEYVQCLRISAARKMLEITSKSVEEITWSVGYNDPNSFRRLFKRKTGLPPGDYRKKFSLYYV